jgi:hypothetical protein
VQLDAVQHVVAVGAVLLRYRQHAGFAGRVDAAKRGIVGHRVRTAADDESGDDAAAKYSSLMPHVRLIGEQRITARIQVGGHLNLIFHPVRRNAAPRRRQLDIPSVTKFCAFGRVRLFGTAQMLW